MSREPMWKEDFVFRRKGAPEAVDDLPLVHGYFESIWYPGAVIGPGGSEYAIFNWLLSGDETVEADCGVLNCYAGHLYIGCNGYRSARVVGPAALRRRALMVRNNDLHQWLMYRWFGALYCDCPVSDPVRIGALFDRIKQELQTNQDDQRLAGYYFELLAELRRQSLPTPERPPELMRALEYLERHLADRNLTQLELAAAARVSRRTLTRLFRCHLNCAPGEYRTRRRLERARELLSVPTLSIKEIAMQCGFSSPEFFARRFRQYYRQTPGGARSAKIQK